MTFSEAKHSVDAMVASVRQGDMGLTDAMVLAAVDTFNNDMAFRTNAESAAYHLMAVVAPVCFRRRHLADELMPVPFFALLGFAVSEAEQALGWLDHHLASGNLFGGMEPTEAAWLRTLVTEKSALIAWFTRAQEWENEMEDA